MTEERRGPGRPRKEVEQSAVIVPSSTMFSDSDNGLDKLKEANSKSCPVCKSNSQPVVCLISKTYTDQHGVGFKGLICSECGTIRIAKGRNGRFIFGYEEKWSLQE